MQVGRWEGHCKGHLCYMYKNPESTPIGTTFFTAVADHSPCTIPTVALPSLIYCYSLFGRCFRTLVMRVPVELSSLPSFIPGFKTLWSESPSRDSYLYYRP